MIRTALAALAGLALLAWSSPAAATAPVALTGPVTDKVGAVTGEEDRILEAFSDLQNDTGIGLYVVYVDGFSGYTAQDWADTTAIGAGLGGEDLLLAVATDERRYTWSVAADFPLSDEQLDQVATDRIEPALGQDDWAGAAIAAADGYRSAYTGTGSSGSGSSAWVAILVIVLIAAAVLLLVLWLRKRRNANAVGAPSAAERKKLTTAQLDTEANRLLVATDDAIRTSEQELGFAEAEFGSEHTAAFAASLESARAELTASFRIRQELDDDEPETEPQRRQMLSDIIDKLVKANKELDAKAADFDRLRNLGQRAPEAAAALRERGAALAPKTAAARQTLTALQSRYPASAIATVADFPDTADDRLAFAAQQLDAADEAVAGGDNGKAALLVRAAEEATQQAEQAVEAVTRRDADLDEAAAALPGVLAEAESDVAEAERLAGATGSGPEAAAKAARLKTVVAEARTAMAAGPVDPLETTAGVERASAELDGELQALRDAVQNIKRAKDQLGQVLMSAQSTTAAVEDYVNTNRGAVGPEARTRLNEAKQQLSQAVALRESDPARALQLAHRADELANAASSAAQRDVRGYLAPSNPNKGSSPMGGNAGAVLGGILLGNLLGGGGGRGSGGYGGTTRRHSPGPGSFGGSGTRGRRGGGGRF
ncbi:TPM domain-containing protein [Glycomyces sp. NPDC046736]|uniref:TPM domain-containing protein n=1 Tax=Glycomyces sp. NPDC046736 TaxID=3155615 RepID=UPI0033C7A74D